MAAKRKENKTTNDVQNTTQKTKDGATWTVLNIGCGDPDG
jgi:hypothetical protein